MKLTLREMETCLTGAPETPQGADRPVAAVRTDSRSVGRGEVFVCLSGERFDGHEFAVQAVAQGALAVVAARPLPEITKVPVVVVRDTVAALGRLGRFLRDRTRAKVVAVTGTAGKTTVKEMIARVAGTRLSVAKNFKNFNNQIGLPLSIFAASGEEDVWVLEAGISKPHDMAELGFILAPDLAVIQNIGPAHLEGLGSLEGVARAKASLLRHLKPEGAALVNRDYPLLWNEALALRPDAVAFSAKDASAAHFCAFLGPEPDATGRFRLKTPGLDRELVLPFCGAHFAENVAATAAVAHHLGLPPEAVVEGLSGFTRPDQRFCCLPGAAWTLIDDTYNANPLSMTRAIETARSMAGDRPLVLVLGAMGELGPEAAEAHEELGRFLRGVAPTRVFFQGGFARDVARGFGSNGSAPLTAVDDPDQMLNAWRQMGLPGGVALVKGSRSARMEQYVAALARELGCSVPGGKTA
ncbi:MAG: UDP-N-acetylmuramoyl-tripeptide--D-alanyl-D-alanine ligase [Desulfovibrionaceae bacterium]|nr:UDP-N-acetylmuramoyl-tripeptide--D-alanyl-D-alanine ligase [Desulfovibrionaceae bacterium]